jgi:hypothetical protein
MNMLGDQIAELKGKYLVSDVEAPTSETSVSVGLPRGNLLLVSRKE